jgi:hypothetical protein
VKSNTEIIPHDFMFQLNDSEFKNLKSQIVTSSWVRVRRAKPYAFTEQGVAMLASVLNSERAIQVNIAIMRTFVRLKKILSTHKELALKFRELETRVERHDEEIQAIFEAIHQLMTPPEKPKRQIGFHIEEPKVKYSFHRRINK